MTGIANAASAGSRLRPWPQAVCVPNAAVHSPLVSCTGSKHLLIVPLRRSSTRHHVASSIWCHYPELISAVVGVGPNSKRVQSIYHALLSELGPELCILRAVEPEQIERRGGQALVAEGIRRMRTGRVRIDPGYDGEYGRVHLFEESEKQ